MSDKARRAFAAPSPPSAVADDLTAAGDEDADNDPPPPAPGRVELSAMVMKQINEHVTALKEIFKSNDPSTSPDIHRDHAKLSAHLMLKYELIRMAAKAASDSGDVEAAAQIQKDLEDLKDLEAQFDAVVGQYICVDVDAAVKATEFSDLLKSLRPQILKVDEITGQFEAEYASLEGGAEGGDAQEKVDHQAILNLLKKTQEELQPLVEDIDQLLGHLLCLVYTKLPLYVDQELLDGFAYYLWDKVDALRERRVEFQNFFTQFGLKISMDRETIEPADQQASADADALAMKGYCSSLADLGKTDYLNSTVLCLAHAPAVREYFLSGQYEKELNRTNRFGSGGEMATAFAELLTEMWCGESDLVHPRNFLKALGQHNEQYAAGSGGQDASHFAIALLDVLHEDTNRVPKKTRTEYPEREPGETDDQLAAKCQENDLKRDNSLVLGLFQGQMKRETVCEYGHVDDAFQPLIDVSVPVPEERTNLLRCFDEYRRKQDIMGEYPCPHCNKLVKGQTQYNLFAPPEYLIVGLNRVVRETVEFGRPTVRKRTTRVDYPLRGLDLSSHILSAKSDERPIYDLYAVTNHVFTRDDTMEGYNTAHFMDDKGVWSYYQDGRVERNVDPARVVSEHARILYYKRQSGETLQSQNAVPEEMNAPRFIGTLEVLLVDAAGGEKMRFKIDRSATPLRRVFSEYAKRGEIPLENIRFIHNGVDIPTDCQMTATQVGIDEANAVINVSYQLMSIYFVYEDGDPDNGDRWELRGYPNFGVDRLFETFVEDKQLELVWNRLTFKYKGKVLPRDCSQSLSQLDMTSGDTIYVALQLPTDEDLGKEVEAIQARGRDNDCPPRFFVNLRVAKDIDEEHVQFGYVESYAEGEAGTIWTAKYPQGGKEEYSKEDLIVHTLYYYEVEGFAHDFNNHVKRTVEDLQSEVSYLKEGKIIRNPAAPLRVVGTADELLLQALKIEQDLGRQIDISLQLKADLQTLKCLWDELLLERKSLVADKLKCRAKSPILECGDTVYAYWWPDDLADDPSWERGTIVSFQCFEDTGYGPRREYSVLFDNGDVQERIAAGNVMHERDFPLVNNFSPTKWKGVERRFDKQSSDSWARNVGWFIVTIDGIEQPFTQLHDALRAYDAHTLHSKGLETERSDLNFPQEFALSKKNQYSGAQMARIHRIRVRLMLACERISDHEMKHIGGILADCIKGEVHMAQEGDGLYQSALGVHWKEAEGHFIDKNASLMKDSVYRVALHWQCLEEAMDVAQLCRFFVAAKGNLNHFLSKVPIFHEGLTWASGGMNAMLSYLKKKKNVPDTRDQYVFVIIADADDRNAKKRYTMSRSSPLKGIISHYAASKDVPVRALRLEHDGRTVFLSTFGKQTPETLGLKDEDVIKVAVMQSSSPEPSAKVVHGSKSKPHKPRGRGKKGKAKKKKKAQPTQPTIEPPVDDEAKMKKMWLDSISRVFAEADPQFREIRQRLNALSLQRTKPKQRKSQPKKESEAEVVDNPSTEGLGGKAGKAYFLVQVGEETNLYKTRKQSPLQIVREIDLHGMTKGEALAKLDECLPKWVDTAMKGEYPWVIAVKIICGGGSQTLAEAVEQWIRKNANVSNAPKNLYCSL